MKKYLSSIASFLLALCSLFVALSYAWMAETYLPPSTFYKNISSVFGCSFYGLLLLSLFFLIKAIIKKKK